MFSAQLTVRKWDASAANLSCVNGGAQLLTHFTQSSKIETVTKGFDARLANRPFLVFDFRTLWRSVLSARVPESQKLKMVG